MAIKITKWDRVFSKYIRTRDNWTCQRCGTGHPPNSQGLHCSHFVGRAKYSVRFSEENCEALCYGCHQYFTSNPDIHRAHKVKRLGRAKFKALKLRSRKLVKKRDVLTKEFYEELKQKLEELPQWQ